MNNGPRTGESQDTDLGECERLIARIDGTVAALARERARLEARARVLEESSAPRTATDAHSHGV